MKAVHDINADGYSFIECHYPNCKKVFKSEYDFGRHLVHHKKLGKKVLPDPDEPLTLDEEYARQLGPGKVLPNVYRPPTLLESVQPETLTLTITEPVLHDDSTLEIPRLQCDICGMTCTNKDPQLQLDLHMKMEHPEQKKLLCPKCGKYFGDEHTLRFHGHGRQRSSAGPKYVVGKNGKLRRNEDASYAGERIKCPKCPREMHQPKLIFHYRMMHMDYKQFACKLCGKQFPTSCNAKYHVMRVHDKRGNMDGKLRKGMDECFEGRDVIEDFRLTDPENFPDKERVLTAVAQAQRAQLEAAGAIVSEVETVTAVKAETVQIAVGPDKTETVVVMA